MGGPVGSSSRAVGAIVRRLAPAALVALMAWVLGTPPGLAQTTSPYTIVQETEVTVDVQLILQGPAGARDVTEFELKGVAGKGLPFREALESGGLKVSTSGSIRATPRSDGTGVDLSIDARSALGGDPESRVDRDLDLSAGRTGLADLWNGGPADSYRLVAAVTVSWEVVPKVVPISPGRQPIDLIVEVLVEREGRRRTLEKHRLGSLVGRSVGYTFTRVAQETEALRGELVVAATPLLMKKATLDLSVRVRLVDRGADAVSPSLDVTVSESLEPGEAVVVPLPNEEGGDPLFVKVTAYF